MDSLNSGALHREQIGPEAAGCTVVDHLTRAWPQAGEAGWRARLSAGQVSLDGRTARAEDPLRPGQWLAWARPPWREPEAPLATAVLHEDAHLLVLAKPSGLPTLPGGGAFQDHTLLALARRRCPEASPLHRLGRFTSGLVLFARTPSDRAPLNTAFRSAGTRKVYRALCSGEPPAEPFTIEAPIGPVPHPVLGSLHAAAPGGRSALSRVTVLERRSGCALVAVEIPTGRPHQIRIHLAWAGHPLVGDPLYAAGGLPCPGSTALPGDPGYRLHAGEVHLLHPFTGRSLHLTCLPPPDLRLGGGPAPLT